MSEVAHMPVAQGWLLQKLRFRLLRNSLQSQLEKSQLRVLSVVGCCVVIWGTIFALCYYGFWELEHRWDFRIDTNLIGFVFNLMFWTLSTLLIFSTGIILYGSLYGAQEAPFLLISPLAPDQIFAYKLQGALGYSSWAFVLLSSPILLAYGLIVPHGAPWYYFVSLPVFLVGFLLLPGAVGAIGALVLVTIVPRRRRQLLILLGVAVLGWIGWWVYSRLLPATRGALSLDAVGDLLNDFNVLRTPYSPTTWIAEGLQAAARDEWLNTLYYLSLVWSHGLFAYVVAAAFARVLYRRGYNNMTSGGSLRRRYGGHWLDAVAQRLLWFVSPQTRLLIVKDFRSFRRDPVQFAQVTILLALAIVYFISMRRYYDPDIDRPWKNGISILNLAATSLLMCAYTGRFIYPMLSLEGRKFWILGLLPLERRQLLWGKFVFSAWGCLVVGEVLVTLSNWMLNMPWYLTLVHALTVGVMALGLSAISVGLGATMPQLRETDASKIAVGFGGTVNLIVSLLFLVVVLVSMAVPLHILMRVRGEIDLHFTADDWWLGVGVLVGLVVGVYAVLAPLRAGTRALEKMEF